MERRKFLLGLGGAGLVLVGGGAWQTARWNAMMADATAPWQAAGQEFGDARLNALAYAILAPNPHNLQPWKVRLEGDDALTLFYNTQKSLPATDPLMRQLTIGLGAFLELLRMAAAARGSALRERLFPEGEPQPVLDDRPIARVQFVRAPGLAVSPLFAHVLKRRTVREQFRDEPVPQAELDELARTELGAPQLRFAASSAPDRVAELKDLSQASWLIEHRTRASFQESVDVTRIGAREIAANPDGISLDGGMMEFGRITRLVTRAGMGTPGSFAHNASETFYSGLIATSRAFGWLVSADNSRRTQLASGAAWLRLHLAATRAGLAMHPLSQALQEFPEMRPEYERAHRLLNAPLPARVQGLFRFGYAAAPPPAPRWPMDAHIMRT